MNHPGKDQVRRLLGNLNGHIAPRWRLLDSSIQEEIHGYWDDLGNATATYLDGKKGWETVMECARVVFCKVVLMSQGRQSQTNAS